MLTIDDLSSETLTRFWAKVRKTDSCWLWQGTSRGGNYGRFYLLAPRKIYVQAHHVAYLLAKGPIPAGLQIDHLCGVRHCVNPDHLEAVTPAVNTLRSHNRAAENARKTHCPQGHPYDESNTIVRFNRREGCFRRTCRICVNEYHRRYRRRQKDRSLVVLALS